MLPEHAKPLNEVLSQSADELKRAGAIVDAFEAARERGEDRALVDGLWVEVPTYRNARRLIERRRALYLLGWMRLSLAGKSVMLVDDGVATGTTVRAALQSLQHSRASRLVLALQVAPTDTAARLRAEAAELVCLWQPALFRCVADFYDDFHQIEDDEVIALLNSASRQRLAE